MGAGVLGAFGWWYWITGTVRTVTVPDVEGKPLNEVQQTLRDQGLSSRVHQEPSMQTPDGNIIRQTPAAGSKIRDNRPVELHVSSGPAYTKVPDLRGETLMEARNNLRERVQTVNQAVASELNLGNVTRIHSEEVEEGHVIAQTPPSGAEVVRGSLVNVLVSMGPWPRRNPVPEVKGEPLERARRILNEAGFELDQPRYNLDPEADPSSVLEQSPGPGVLLERGESVSLTVNLDDPEPREPRTYHTVLRLSPPVGELKPTLRVVRKDLTGEVTVHEGTVQTGALVKLPLRFLGSATVYVYWNDNLSRIRTLEPRPSVQP